MSRFGALVAAEWIKFRSLWSSYAAMAVVALIALSGAAFSAVHLRLSPYGISSLDPLAQAFNSGTWAVMMAAAACIGAGSLLGEFNSGLIRTTLIAVPARRRLIAAKATMLATLMAVVGAVLAAASIVLSQILLNPGYKVHRISAPAAAIDVAGGAASLAVCAVVGLAAAALLRNGVVSLLFCAALADRVYADGHATTPLTHTAQTWLISAGWLAVAAAASIALVDRRDV